MDYTKENEDDDGEEGGLFFIEDSGSSEGEGEIEFTHQKHHSSCKEAARLSRESSPPLLLAFNITSGRAASSLEQEQEVEVEEDSDQPIEEWMMLGGEEQVGDSSIQLNLSYWSEDDSGDEG